jgi:hypothetical protein
MCACLLEIVLLFSWGGISKLSYRKRVAALVSPQAVVKRCSCAGSLILPTRAMKASRNWPVSSTTVAKELAMHASGPQAGRPTSRRGLPTFSLTLLIRLLLLMWSKGLRKNRIRGLLKPLQYESTRAIRWVFLHPTNVSRDHVFRSPRAKVTDPRRIPAENPIPNASTSERSDNKAVPIVITIVYARQVNTKHTKGTRWNERPCLLAWLTSYVNHRLMLFNQASKQAALPIFLERPLVVSRK